MYWPAFEFRYRLDLARLMPHIAAIESYRQAAVTRVLPPLWREQPPEPDSNSPQDLKATHLARARSWVTERFAPGSAPLSLDDLLTMHRIAADASNPECTPGVLRKLAVQVGRREVGGLHLGAPAESLPRLMEQYIQFITSEKSLKLHPVMHALVAHFFLVTIHPFGDANGRVSRLLTTGLLCQRGYNVHGGFYALSAYFYQNDIEYHTILHRCWLLSPPFDLTQFVAFGMQGFVMELRSIDSFVKMKLNRIVDRETLIAAAHRKRSRTFWQMTHRWPSVFL
jgi:Fic family protein